MSLSVKQRRFASLVAGGTSQAEAYRQAYKPKGDCPDAAKRGYKVASHPEVKAYLASLKGREDAAEYYTARLRREFVVKGLMREAETAESDAARVRALELLGKMYDVRLFADGIDAAQAANAARRDPAQVMQELQARLARIGNDLIDVTPENPDDSMA